MKTFIAITCLLAVTTAVYGIDQDSVIPKYMEYLMPDVKPCADELHISENVATNIQQAQNVDVRQMGCLKACVMKRMQVLTGNLEFHLEPIYKMIDIVHADSAADIELVKKIATDCGEEIKGETDECNLGNKYTSCYIEKLFT